MPVPYGSDGSTDFTTSLAVVALAAFVVLVVLVVLDLLADVDALEVADDFDALEPDEADPHPANKSPHAKTPAITATSTTFIFRETMSNPPFVLPAASRAAAALRDTFT